MEDQPLPANASPTALSLGYVVDSDPKKDEKDPKEDPAYYPTDRGNNDDDVEKDEEDKEKEEHLAPADPSDVSTDDLMAKSVALVVFGSTWTIMVIVAFRTQWLRSAVMFLLPMPCSVNSANVLPLIQLSLVLIILRSVIQPLLILGLAFS
nr:hypothetical protein [Tanacetum cinerariifolium]